MQCSLESGRSILGIILASDKTPLTIGTGNKQLHPLLLSLANIPAEVRMKATANAFALLAYLPIPKFTDVSTDVQSLLSAHVFHECLSIITEDLKHAELRGVTVSDPCGLLRDVHTPLMSYIADYPDMQLVAGVSAGSSPLSVATKKEFGNATPSAVRTRMHTLDRIRLSLQYHHPWTDLAQLCKIYKRQGLNGIYQPFWEDWGNADPSSFLTSDALHQWHKFFFNHVLKWASNIVGVSEFDRKLSCLQPMVGEHRWKKGVSKLKQLTGREHRELEKVVVPLMVGVDPTAVAAIHAIVDFIFQAQSLLCYNETSASLRSALAEFFHFSMSVVREGGRKGKNGPIPHFQIPKLELMQHVARTIPEMGALYQWTSDVTERCHITHVKKLLTNATLMVNVCVTLTAWKKCVCSVYILTISCIKLILLQTK